MNDLFAQLIVSLQAARDQAAAGLTQFDDTIAQAQAQLDTAAAQRAVYEDYVAQLDAAIAALQQEP